MIFEKDGRTLEVVDPAHIDCLKSKGWNEVKDKPKKKNK